MSPDAAVERLDVRLLRDVEPLDRVVGLGDVGGHPPPGGGELLEELLHLGDVLLRGVLDPGVVLRVPAVEEVGHLEEVDPFLGAEVGHVRVQLGGEVDQVTEVAVIAALDGDDVLGLGVLPGEPESEGESV